MSDQSYYNEYWRESTVWSPAGGGLHPIERRLFSQYLRPGSRCLDYGCGDGSRYAACLVRDGIEYAGFDVSNRAVERGRACGLDLRVLAPDGRTDLHDASVDVALCFEVLEHLLEPNAALMEIRRCLKPGGVVLASVPNAGFWWNRLEFLATGSWIPGGSPLCGRKEPWRDPHIRFFSPRLLHKLFERCGFLNRRVLGEQFSLSALPYVYRQPHLARAFKTASLPLAWLGPAAPALFSARLFLVASMAPTITPP